MYKTKKAWSRYISYIFRRNSILVFLRRIRLGFLRSMRFVGEVDGVEADESMLLLWPEPTLDEPEVKPEVIVVVAVPVVVKGIETGEGGEFEGRDIKLIA